MSFVELFLVVGGPILARAKSSHVMNEIANNPVLLKVNYEIFYRLGGRK